MTPALLTEAQALVSRLGKTTKARDMLQRMIAAALQDNTALTEADLMATAEWPVTTAGRVLACAHCEGIAPDQRGALDTDVVGHSPDCHLQAYKVARGLP